MDEPTPVIKKKRKYQKRGTHKLVVDGKRYVGSDIRREGNFLILKTAKGSVFANTALSAVIEVEGVISTGQQNIPWTTASQSAPVMSGGAAMFKARRDRELEGLMALPQMGDES